MQNRIKIIGLVVVSLLIGAGLTVLAALQWGLPGVQTSSAGAPRSGDPQDPGDHDHADEHGSDTYYTCPMHPSVVSDSPGACPVCQMDLVEKKKSATGLDPRELAKVGKVALSPTQRVLANVKTTPVKTLDATGEVRSDIRAVGVVNFDESGLATIPSWVSGRIQRLLVRETGARVRRGQAVMRIYSPELLTAQEEYLVALSSPQADTSLIRQARRRLELLGMSNAQISRVQETGKATEHVTMTAPNAGTITAMKVRQGQYVQEGSPLYEIADLSKVWVDAEVPERHLAAIDRGMKVRVSAQALGAEANPGGTRAGEVAFIHPVVDEKTRTVKVRIEMNNDDQKLKPGMYATVFFERKQAESEVEPEAGGAATRMVVPKSAVIRGGESSSAYVEVDDNVFERRDVQVSAAADDYLIIESGLEVGEEVAYQGGFLLDSEVQLNSFGGNSGPGHEGHGMGDGEHTEMSAADIPKDGKKFDPPVPSASVPEGMWFCDMGTSHWVQHDKGDGECPVCGMFLKQQGASEEGADADTDENSKTKKGAK